MTEKVKSMNQYHRPLPPDHIQVVTVEGNYPHAFQRKMQTLMKQGKIKAGKISALDVAHDDWCDLYSGNLCNCDPTIVNVLTGEVYQ